MFTFGPYLNTMRVNLEAFVHIFAEELSIRESAISPHSLFRELPFWCSLNALLIISRINEEFGVLISSSDLANCQMILDIYNLINQRK